MDSAVQAALDAFERDEVRGEDVVRAERAIPLDQVIALSRRLDPAVDPFWAPSPAKDALERLELAADLDALVGSLPWGLPSDAVADAYALAGEPELAHEARLRALSRTPRWDSVLAARQLARVAADERARGHREAADTLDRRAAQLDPTRAIDVELRGLDPLSDVGLVDLFLAAEYGSLLGDHLASPRRFALACVRRDEVGLARMPLYVTRDWELYVDDVAQALRLGTDPSLTTDAADNARLLSAIEATPAGSDAAKQSRMKTPNAFSTNENVRIRFFAELAAKGNWYEVRRGLLSWDRKCRLFVGGLLAMEGEALGTSYVERAAALAEELSHDGYEVGGDWALPRKVLARKRGDTSVTWCGL